MASKPISSLAQLKGKRVGVIDFKDNLVLILAPGYRRLDLTHSRMWNGSGTFIQRIRPPRSEPEKWTPYFAIHSTFAIWKEKASTTFGILPLTILKAAQIGSSYLNGSRNVICGQPLFAKHDDVKRRDSSIRNSEGAAPSPSRRRELILV